MTFKEGDKVAYSVQFLESIGMSHSDFARARGVVTDVKHTYRKSERLVNGERCTITVDWDSDDIPARILDCNLALVGLNSRFCKC